MNEAYVLDYGSKAAMLGQAVGTGGRFDPATIKLYLVSSAQINPTGDALMTKVQPGNGLDANKAVTAWSAVSRGQRTAPCSSRPTSSPGCPTAATRGARRSGGWRSVPRRTSNNAFAYAEFDKSVTVLFANQPTSVVLELGYNGKEFYIAARRIPVGE